MYVVTKEESVSTIEKVKERQREEQWEYVCL